MSIVYPLSADPIHGGHLNILTKASTDSAVVLLLCRNPLKTGGLLNMEERSKDAVITQIARGIESGSIATRSEVPRALLSFQLGVRVAGNIVQIFRELEGASSIVRGVRSISDIDYSLKLLRYFRSQHWLQKAIPIQQDSHFEDVSSTEYKRAYGSMCEEFPTFPKVYGFLDKQRIDVQCSRLGGETNLALVENIRSYYALVCGLQKGGWFDEVSL